MSKAISIKPHRVRWIRDEAGIAHAVKQSDGVHCSAHCRRYVRGEWFIVEKGEYVAMTCPNCAVKLENPIATSTDEPTPRTVLLGRGIQNELRRRTKGRD